MNKKTAIMCCVIGAIGLTYGGMNFEFQGIDSPLTAITVSISLALGAAVFLYGAYNVFKGKPKTTTTANKGEKPMANKKKEPKTIASVTNTSVELMKRETELFDRKKEFEKLVSEIKSELAEVQEKISSKGWTAKEDGSWGIE